ncbi:unnamed protein product [Clonostachys chloroleuca]|uniref:Uncharacterized protein n=1 Tax=Clonostachys chloroleuca TaxID=1926264 RepID=A0AA35MJP3_9HYPO|nr:unnamed protein product [Clonostachys chloroleuca]
MCIEDAPGHASYSRRVPGRGSRALLAYGCSLRESATHTHATGIVCRRNGMIVRAVRVSGDRGLVAGQLVDVERQKAPAKEAEAKAEGPSWNRDHIEKTSSGHLRWQVVQADTWATSSHRHGRNGADELEAADGGNWAPQGRSMRDGRRAFAPCDQRFWGGDRHASCVTWQQLAPLFLQVPPEVEGEDGAVVGLDGSRQQPTLTRDSRFSRVLGRRNSCHVDLEMDKPESHRVPVSSHHVAVTVARRPS